MIFIKTNRDFDCFRFIIGLIRTGGISSGFLVPNTTPDSSTYAVRVSTDSTRYSEVVQTIGSEVTITNFLMKGGAQRIKLETVKLISQSSWNVVSSVTADVIIKYTEGKF